MAGQEDALLVASQDEYVRVRVAAARRDERAAAAARRRVRALDVAARRLVVEAAGAAGARERGGARGRVRREARDHGVGRAAHGRVGGGERVRRALMVVVANVERHDEAGRVLGVVAHHVDDLLYLLGAHLRLLRRQQLLLHLSIG